MRQYNDAESRNNKRLCNKEQDQNNNYSFLLPLPEPGKHLIGTINGKINGLIGDVR